MFANVLREKVRTALFVASYMRGMKRHRLYRIMERHDSRCYTQSRSLHLLETNIREQHFGIRNGGSVQDFPSE